MSFGRVLFEWLLLQNNEGLFFDKNQAGDNKMKNPKLVWDFFSLLLVVTNFFSVLFS
jgi:hypothetical protein